MKPAAPHPSLAPMLAAVLLVATPSTAAIDLELRHDGATPAVGDVVELGLYAVADGDAPQLLAALNAIITWDPARLSLLGNDDDGGAPLLSSGFGAEPHGLNEATPPADGDAMYVAFAFFGAPIAATPEGTLVTTIELEALAPTSGTEVSLLAEGGAPTGYTTVFDGTVPNLPVTGALGAATIEIAGGDGCPEDLDGNGLVDVVDLLGLLVAWGTDDGGADLDGTGVVDVQDLLVLLSAWGPC